MAALSPKIGSEQGLGSDKDLYRPFVKFWDRGNDPVMTLTGVGLNLIQSDSSATFDFLGVDIGNKDTHFFVHPEMLSYVSKGGNLQILPTENGMDLTVASVARDGRENSVFGVLAKPMNLPCMSPLTVTRWT